MIDLRFVASVAERDIDFLLVEELSVNSEFCDWFASRLFRRPIFKSSLGTWHSVTDAALGESDILHLFRSEDDGRIAVLIENKIDAVAQPRQPHRYRERGEKGKQSQDWDDFITCVIAPNQYLEIGNQTDGYDCRISYEELMSFFVSRRSRDSRYLFKAQLVREAIEKNRRGPQSEISTEMTEFIQRYCALAARISPMSGVQEAKPRPAGSTWVMFKPSGVPKQVSFAHQLTAGYAKLFIANSVENEEKLKAQFMPLLGNDMEFGVSGKSVTVSVAVPRVDPLSHSFAEEEAHVVEGIRAVERLLEICRRAIVTMGLGM